METEEIQEEYFFSGDSIFMEEARIRKHLAATFLEICKGLGMLPFGYKGLHRQPFLHAT